MNLTKEIIDEISILYRESPVYQVVDDKGVQLKDDQKLWEDIQKDSRYVSFMDKLDRWTRLLGTVLVKVSFVDPTTGQLVAQDAGGSVQLDMLHGGVYDLKHGASPYYITELLIGFGSQFSGFAGYDRKPAVSPQQTSVAAGVPSPSNLGNSSIEARQKVDSPDQLKSINRIFWSPESHLVQDEEGGEYTTENPYGIVPAIPFFNQDPAHYYFLPINEPLIYANHALNMRITDLNHIAKFQSFGVPVVSGIERPTSTRQGRPVDDFNVLKGGSAQSSFGGVGGVAGFGAGGKFRTFDAGFGINRDGNADANSLGMSIGPDTAIAVGEKGSFKFEHPNADITGLIKTIESITDMVRINHGLRPKYKDSLPSSGFALMMEKIGVIEDNGRRSKLFKEREEQLFQVIKTLWNVHHKKSGERKFSAKATLDITYVQPEFPVDPKTKMEQLIMESKIIESGDKTSISKISAYAHLSDIEITKLVKRRRKDMMEQAKFEAEVEVARALILQEAGITESSTDSSAKISEKGSTATQKTKISIQSDGTDGVGIDVTAPKIDNRAKQAVDSSKQPNRNGDTRSTPKKTKTTSGNKK